MWKIKYCIERYRDDSIFIIGRKGNFYVILLLLFDNDDVLR